MWKWFLIVAYLAMGGMILAVSLWKSNQRVSLKQKQVSVFASVGDDLMAGETDEMLLSQVWAQQLWWRLADDPLEQSKRLLQLSRWRLQTACQLARAGQTAVLVRQLARAAAYQARARDLGQQLPEIEKSDWHTAWQLHVEWQTQQISDLIPQLQSPEREILMRWKDTQLIE